MKTVATLGRLRVVEDDPYNNHRQYLVTVRFRSETATLDSACNEGEVEGIELSTTECQWLNQLERTLPYDL